MLFILLPAESIIKFNTPVVQCSFSFCTGLALDAVDAVDAENAAHYMDCKELYDNGRHQSGVYRINPFGKRGHAISVYCDMEMKGGGWTVSVFSILISISS
jgi:hypothetical protein